MSKIEQKVGYLTDSGVANRENGRLFAVHSGNVEPATHKCVYMIVPLDCPTPGDEAVDEFGNRFPVGSMRPNAFDGQTMWYCEGGGSRFGCTLYTEPDDSEVMVSIADVKKEISGEQAMQWTRLSELAEKVANRLRAGASDE